MVGNKKTPLGARLLDCFFLLRIALLAPVWTILLVGWITGGKHGTVFTACSSLQCKDAGAAYLWLALAGFSLVVASIYVVNQIADIESDRINHKLFLLPHGYLSVRTAWVLVAACASIGLTSAFLFDMEMAALYVTGLVLGFFYNLPPLQLKNRAWGGVIANILGHGMVTFLVGWHAGHFPDSLAGENPLRGLLSSLSPGMAIAAVFLATTIPDAAGDRLTNKKTFCIRYGEKKTALAAALFCAAALLSSVFMENNFWVMAIPSTMSLALFVALACTANTRAAFHAFKWPVFLLTAFVIIFVPIYGVLILLTFFGSRAYYRWRFSIEYPTFKTK